LILRVKSKKEKLERVTPITNPGWFDSTREPVMIQ
jgi:hypothetical protein